MKKFVKLVFFLLLFGNAECHTANAGLITLDFEHLESQNNYKFGGPGQVYSNSGFEISVNHSRADWRYFLVFGTSSPQFVDSTSLTGAYGPVSFTLRSADGSQFSIESMDFAELTPTPYPGLEFETVSLTATSIGGYTETYTFDLDGAPGQQTVYFENFDNITSLSWSQEASGHSFDNIVINDSPPGSKPENPVTPESTGETTKPTPEFDDQSIVPPGSIVIEESPVHDLGEIPVPRSSSPAGPINPNTVYIDPPAVIGFEYRVDGPNFQSVFLPDFGDNEFYYGLWNGNQYEIQSQSLYSGIPHDFGLGGVERFLLMGIEPSAGATGEAGDGFVAGFTFADQGIAHITMLPIQTEPSVVPEPSTFALLGIGGLVLTGYGWRRKRQSAASIKS